MKLNRLIFLFRYYPTKHPRKYISMVIGISGSLIGYYLWKDHFPFLSKNDLEYTLYLFIPSSIAIISALFYKTYLMYLAVVLSLPIAHHLVFINYVPLVCYLISALLGSTKSLTKKDKEELEKIITEQVEWIERETKEKLRVAEILMEQHPSQSTTYMIDKTYQINLPTAIYIKGNYDFYLKTKGAPFANTYRLGIFYVLTRTNGIWDLKQTIGDVTLYTFKGTMETGEYIGNHHFGYMGKAAGFNCRVLRIAAGMYQVYSGTSHWKYIFSYYDNPDDSKAIQDGCADYDMGYRF
ncbi:polymorphic toxin type 44 domain-containing protein [Heyndrickxia sp. NPDC080065]|uniref:polymorphic toxin type 44 domain-containing protein n=1 Tax=Heyndrickxia sp. NPDC080065 TaxID=3390568 RepID=UPI003D071353